MNDIKLNQYTKPETMERQLAKIIRDNSKPPTGRAQLPELGVLNRISSQTEEAINDYKYIKELLPDLKLVEQIMCSSITTSTASKNLLAIEYTLKMPETGYASKIYGSMMAALNEYFKNTYKIAEIIPDIVHKALFQQGSVPYLILPESSLDTMIQNAVSMEDASAVNIAIKNSIGDKDKIISKGYLGSYKNTREEFSFETMDLVPNTERDISECYLVGDKSLNTIVVDNFDIMKRPYLVDRFKQQQVANKLATNGRMHTGASLEDANDQEQRRIKEAQRKELIDSIFQSTKGHKRFDSIPIVQHSNNENYGEPMDFVIPAGAVIPIHPPGDPKNPEAFLIMLDESGKPIDTSVYLTYYNQQRSSKENKASAVTAALRNAATTAGITQYQGANLKDLDSLADCYSSLMDQDIIRRHENAQGRTMELGGNKNNRGRVMLSRLMKNQRTVLMYVPAELMVYYAFDYNDYGIGTSLVEQTKTLSVMRINTLLANAVAVQRNAIGTTLLNIELAENDMEPHKSVHEIVNQHLFNRSSGLNLMSTDPLTSLEQAARAGVHVAVSGSPRYPNTSVTLTETNGQRAVIDEAFLEDQRRNWLMGFGMIPEMVDQTSSPEFAAQVFSNNAMFVKMVAYYKRILSVLCTKHIRTHSLFSSTVRRTLMQVITENLKEIPEEFRELHKGMENSELADELFKDFISSVQLVFPDIAATTNQQVMDDFNAKRTLVEATVKEFISAENFSDESLGKLKEMGVTLDVFASRITASIMRQYIRENNLSPQLMEIGNKEDNSYLTETFEEILEHESSIRDTILEFILEQTERISNFNEEAEKQIAKTEKKFGPVVEGVDGGIMDDGSTAPETDDGSELDGGEDDWSSSGFGEAVDTPETEEPTTTETGETKTPETEEEEETPPEETPPQE